MGCERCHGDELPVALLCLLVGLPPYSGWILSRCVEEKRYCTSPG
jgi:hypothetical protein